MKILKDLEKKINSELTTKINKSETKHNQLYVEIDKDDLIDVVLFIKTNKDLKFRQLIDITAVDYPDQTQRFKIVYLFLSHEFNQRIILSYFINENEIIKLNQFKLKKTNFIDLLKLQIQDKKTLDLRNWN